MGHEATLQFITDLDRAGIEKHLAAIADKATARGAAEVATLLAGAPGKPRAELDALIVTCIGLLKQDKANSGLVDELDMVQMNLPNLG